MARTIGVAEAAAEVDVAAAGQRPPVGTEGQRGREHQALHEHAEAEGGEPLPAHEATKIIGEVLSELD